ncbi:threonine--tRNA ligase [Mesomycoplasma hyorhinis]|uniref:Threonine--tRNA ligase n=1 Tax=Mesomycoplasma hyorhinis SK76 TaxID=1118964 RepID=A0AAI8FE53_MESHY|nr:threonine--tRNA ligase [Mesomycoplasma hyorhinis]ADM22056.1 Threonyl-tRNA synthetase [Mesomycoplasma hyorhinis HUB-1]AFX74601.1 Threonyl-tRNA synthetase [Mesomycoplasma hyorhinis SK76]QPC29576.1 threonine--tRNA ligase [Mesomycoplasma hyorhinis]UVT34240.1 threonine--tRNA ligase [Mesomycoplasma hyorhinis]
MKNINKELNHSASHLLALAVIKLFPDVQLGFGPATDEGFYYDFKFVNPLSEHDLIKIEKMMQKLANNNFVMKQTLGTQIDFSKQIFKKELLDQFTSENRKITFFSIVNPTKNEYLFEDLCAGGHIENMKQIKHFKLLSIAGAYWRGKVENEQLTRIYGTAWDTKEELEEFLHILQERKERDHRKLGKELKLFTFNKLFGQGFPIWLEDGMKIVNKIKEKILFYDKKYGFKEVFTPHFGEQKLYEISGHFTHYKEDMFGALVVEGENLIPRPMTCPHHIILFDTFKKSYRELPYRISEQSRLYRYEKSGALTGLERVRSMLLTEGHIFVAKTQIVDEFKHLYQMISEVLKFFKIEVNYVSFSKRDPENKEKFFDDDQMWNQAESDLEKVLKELGVEYQEKIGEAAFYGPKIDFQIKTVLNHEITISTLQLDFLLPKKFDISFINQDNAKETPILIHRGLIGTYERFVSILLEQTKGILPFWLSPKQFVVIPIENSKHSDFALEIAKKLEELNFNVTVDDRNERINKKIREAQMQKTKFQIIVGDQEVENKNITYREYGQQNSNTLNFEDLIKFIKAKIENNE